MDRIPLGNSMLCHAITGGISRRGFLKSALAASLVAGAGLPLCAADAPSTASGQVLRRPLGRTGETVSAIGLGGLHIGHIRDASLAERLIHTAVDSGVTLMDTSWDYLKGASETRMGKALSDRRAKVFLMTKIDGRTKAAAAKQIDQSLKRLMTDHVDLLQFNEIIRMDDPDRIFAVGGAIEAVVAAQKAGKVRFIGFSGHKDPAFHLRMLKVAGEHKFRFDAVQMPLNVMDAHYQSFEHHVLPLLVKDEIGVLGMKSLGDGLILKCGAVSPAECFRYVLSLPVSTLVVGLDTLAFLDQAVEAMRKFTPLDENEISVLLSMTSQPALTGKYELFKTKDRYDLTAHNPEWLG